MNPAEQKHHRVPRSRLYSPAVHFALLQTFIFIDHDSTSTEGIQTAENWLACFD